MDNRLISWSFNKAISSKHKKPLNIPPRKRRKKRDSIEPLKNATNPPHRGNQISLAYVEPSVEKTLVNPTCSTRDPINLYRSRAQVSYVMPWLCKKLPAKREEKTQTDLWFDNRKVRLQRKGRSAFVSLWWWSRGGFVVPFQWICKISTLFLSNFFRCNSIWFRMRGIMWIKIPSPSPLWIVANSANDGDASASDQSIDLICVNDPVQVVKNT